MIQKVSSNTINASFVRSIPLFSGLSGAEKDELINKGSFYSYPRKRKLFHHGDPVTRFYVICGGAVRLYHETPDGREVTSHFRIAGDTICTTEIFLPDGIHHAHAEAVTDVTVMEFSTEWLRENLRQNGIISLNLFRILSERMHKLEVEIENQATKSAAELLACFLIRTCAIYQFNPDGFELPYNKSLIASRLGMQLETLSRTFVKLKEVGITVKGKHVSFDDLESVEKSICGHCSAAVSCTECSCSGEKKCHMYKCGIQKNLPHDPLPSRRH